MKDPEKAGVDPAHHAPAIEKDPDLVAGTGVGNDGLFEHNSSTSSSIKQKNAHSDIESLHSKTAEAGGGERGNILAQYSEKQTMQMGRNYAIKHGLDPELFARAAALARLPHEFNSMPFLSEDEKVGLNKEATKRWHIPLKLVAVIALGSMAAAVQGMDESVINGATLFYPKEMGLLDMKEPQLMEGLINGAPYLCASTIACWMSDAWNKRLGRKWTIFWTCLISAITCIWQALVNLKWYHLFLARFFLGFGIGIKSATVPAYAAETTPHTIRETKGLTLEELDDVFGVSTTKHAKYQTKQLFINLRRYILRQNVADQPPLYTHQRMAVTNPEWNDKAEVSHVE
ncbi:hypothetical protein HYPBUDRAFT_147787 [Hyphopichia burtonii NRRL Y-1933]|uniref:Major facilitator superfamily (MFS) profile domain-containing protein n=1 Tax=Hyphopichia burtonii NRRL Y-1933 TaxID=984485 RepID=A0A1E4RK44_9ASCO|nr:hypothetical protein HYPBUDRAFT_147787 [Hyphopichia burtonii NRRL Y-1933]ODV67455.1 hypothetical protein HYPBUDRAFT_147787 [Hyphopichia burtonii NRRL Y-1933]